MDERYYVTYDAFQNSDFWLFFHIREKTAQKRPNNDTLISLEPGNWQSEINLNITVNQKMQLIHGRLDLTRDWVSGLHDPANPFALDIARNFIGALIPSPDRPKILELGRSFQMSEAMKVRHEMQDDDLVKLLDSQAPETMAYRALLTFMGASASFLQAFDFSNISMTNSKYGEHEWLQIEVSIIHAPVI
jgi:hypothetical protein